MSAAFIVPFNHQPFSVSVKTASYTIPAGYYARSVVECDSGGTFTIDASTAVSTSAFINIDQAATTALDVTYTSPTGTRAIISALGSNQPDTVTANGNTGTKTLTGNVMSETTINLGPSGSLTMVTGGGSRTYGISGVGIPSNATHRNDVFWLPTGTVINGAGNWKAVVELYPMIS